MGASIVGLGKSLGHALGTAARTIKSGAPYEQGGSILERTVPYQNETGNWELSNVLFSDIVALSPAAMYRTQPHLRTVVSFMARNIAQLGLHSFDRVSDSDRQRLTSDVTAKLFKQPNAYHTGYELIYALVSDLALNDDAYWHVTVNLDSPSGWQILPINAAWVQGVKGGNAFRPDYYTIQKPNGMSYDIPANQIIAFHGWNPTLATGGISPVTTLKEVLLEQVSALRYRNQVWDKGGRVGTVITRPAGATWTTEQKDRFLSAFRSAYTGNHGSQAGGIPLLEDGMTMQRMGFSAKEDDYIEGTKLALGTVAAVFHINPTMIGQLDAANYSNVQAFAAGLFGHTLGPVIQMIEARINAFLLPMIGAKDTAYVEFNVAEKLKGNFEARAAIMQSAVGGPWMSVNEARALDNRPPIEGGDDVLSPLNMTAVGAEPVEVAPPVLPPVEPEPVALPPAEAPPKAITVNSDADPLASFLARQRRSALSAKGAGKTDWWDEARWARELTAAMPDLDADTVKSINATAKAEMESSC